jgi:hypothetical protein
MSVSKLPHNWQTLLTQLTRHWHLSDNPWNVSSQINVNHYWQYWHISYTDKVWHVRHSKMSLSIACRRKMSQVCRDRRHVGDMSVTYPAKLSPILRRAPRSIPTHLHLIALALSQLGSHTKLISLTFDWGNEIHVQSYIRFALCRYYHPHHPSSQWHRRL